MNMKKTIAAISAAAVAVSAMAATVSAEETTKTFTYTLVDHITSYGVGTAVFQATIQNAVVPDGAGGATLAANLVFNNFNNNYSKVKEMVLKINAKGAGEQNKTFVYGTDKNAANYNVNLTNAGFKFTNELDGFPAGALIDVQVTLTVETNDTLKSYEDVNNNMITITANDGATPPAAFGAPTPTVCIDYKRASLGNVAYPFESRSTKNNDIIRYLETIDRDGSTQDIESYVNVGAVINDAIKNSTNVTFKFNTATQMVAFVPEVNYGGGDVIADWDRYATYEEAFAVSRNGANPAVTPEAYGIYDDWNKGTNMYKQFGQHLYDWNYAIENTQNAGYDWVGTNLFAGALVINEHLTMSLAETDVFDWTETSLSFDWDSIQQNAMTDNDFANYVQTMRLATSTRWYWDSMDLILTLGDADDAAADAGVDGDGADIDDTDDGDDIDLDDTDVDDGDDVDTDDTDDTDAPADDTDDTDVPAEQPASNPTTGNASVALAVIPVALAAAAIVAKKRG